MRLCFSSVDRLYVKQYRMKKTKNNLIIRRASQSGNTSIPSKYPTMQMWKPILASCTEPSIDTIRNLESYPFQSPKTNKSDRCFVTVPMILLFPFY